MIKDTGEDNMKHIDEIWLLEDAAHYPIRKYGIWGVGESMNDDQNKRFLKRAINDNQRNNQEVPGR